MYIGLSNLGLTGRRNDDSFNPKSALWPLGTEAGMWLDQSHSETGWQESSGETAGVVDSPIGLRLDKRLGLARGPDVTNGGFSTDTAWTKGGNWTISDDQANSGVGNGEIYQNYSSPIANGDWFEISYTLVSLTAGQVYAHIGGATVLSTQNNIVGAQHFIVPASGVLNDRVGISVGNSPSNIVIDNLSIRRLSGNHVLQATAAARSTWRLTSGIYLDSMDGVDDGYATVSFSAGTLTANMDCFIAIKRNSVADGIPASDGAAARFFGAWDAGDAVSRPDTGSGTPTYVVNGTGVTANRQALETALGNGTWKILEVRNLDLSSWLSFSVSLFGAGWFTNADFGGLILCPAQTAGIRDEVRTFLGNKVGLVL